MPMSGDILGPAIMKAIDDLSDDDKKDRSKVFKAMAGAIVLHIQSNAGIVAGPILGLATAPGGGPVAGAATLAPGFIK